MPEDGSEGVAHEQPTDRRARMNSNARRILTARSILGDVLPKGYAHGPLPDMLLWLYLNVGRSEEALYDATATSATRSNALRWTKVLLQDRFAVRTATGLALTPAGARLVETVLEALPPIDWPPVLQ
jgi:hypothetical protein